MDRTLDQKPPRHGAKAPVETDTSIPIPNVLRERLEHGATGTAVLASLKKSGWEGFSSVDLVLDVRSGSLLVTNAPLRQHHFRDGNIVTVDNYKVIRTEYYDPYGPTRRETLDVAVKPLLAKAREPLNDTLTDAVAKYKSQYPIKSFFYRTLAKLRSSGPRINIKG